MLKKRLGIETARDNVFTTKKHLSQIPALQLLISLGYEHRSPATPIPHAKARPYAKITNWEMEGGGVNINFRNYRATLLISLIGILWSLSSWVLSYLWNYGFLQGTAPTAIVLSLLYIYDQYLWKYPVFSLLVKIPNLNGKYNGTVSYHYEGKEQSKNCSLEIQQTASHIKVTSTFEKQGKSENRTTSESKEALFSQDEFDNHNLLFYYSNKGSCKAGDTLDQHDGFNRLEVKEAKNKIILDGYYFTNRNPQTKGKIEVTKQLIEVK